ncbi:hypothetical protein ACOMHN_009797 [Nucella lapillus]
MGKGGRAEQKGMREVTLEEVNEHNKRDDKWLIINGKAYDITNFAKRHPGGAKVITHYAGEDATDAWTAFHNDKDFVSKHLAALYVGDVVDYKPSTVQDDFRQLRETVEKKGWLKPDPLFFTLHLAHVMALEAMAFGVFWYWGTGWLPCLAAVLLYATAQAQAGWTQHDYGHLSVFRNSSINHAFHQLTVGFIKGASSHWWNFRHFQHHAKPNRVSKDPDVDMAYLFLMGDEMPKKWGAQKKGFMPYNFQHRYFFMLGPPLLLPLYFHFEVLYFCIRRRAYLDFFMTVAFFVRLHLLFASFLGTFGNFIFYMVARMLESHWFVWITQMSHLPHDVRHDRQDEDWVTLQLNTTCNVTSNTFNDWFSGHLNYQIEHHLFPTMPRHHYHKVAPLVQSLCKKHDINYRCKPMFTAWADVVRSLKKSGEIWYEAYHE